MPARAQPELRWLDADEAAHYVSLKTSAFLRRVRQGLFPEPSYAAGERCPRWWQGDIDAVMKPDTASTNIKLAVAGFVQKEAEKGRARRDAHARGRHPETIPIQRLPAQKTKH